MTGLAVFGVLWVVFAWWLACTVCPKRTRRKHPFRQDAEMWEKIADHAAKERTK